MPFKRVPRLRSFDYLGARRYFLTFCTGARQPVFVDGDAVAHCRNSRGQTLWQRSYYEHVLRDGESTIGIARYILENPLRAGLATRVDEYPYLGSMTMSIEDLLYSVSDDR